MRLAAKRYCASYPAGTKSAPCAGCWRSEGASTVVDARNRDLRSVLRPRSRKLLTRLRTCELGLRPHPSVVSAPPLTGPRELFYSPTGGGG
jgi:hypothetical protein